jgi:hypothetical protein
MYFKFTYLFAQSLVKEKNLFAQLFPKFHWKELFSYAQLPEYRVLILVSLLIGLYLEFYF